MMLKLPVEETKMTISDMTDAIVVLSWASLLGDTVDASVDLRFHEAHSSNFCPVGESQCPGVLGVGSVVVIATRSFSRAADKRSERNAEVLFQPEACKLPDGYTITEIFGRFPDFRAVILVLTPRPSADLNCAPEQAIEDQSEIRRLVRKWGS